MNTATHFIPLTIFIIAFSLQTAISLATTELLAGFRSTPNPSTSSFQPLLNDSTANYALGFLRVNEDHLSLSVLHLPSSVPLWSANTTRLPKWSDPVTLLFNGNLVLSDSHSGVLWSTDTTGYRVWLSNNSNLQIQVTGTGNVLWQSFDFPSDTLVERQNFTSTMSLVSSNGLYSMRLGPDYFGLYARFSSSAPAQMYLLHRALEAKANIVENQPIHLVLQPDGYLGMFQNSSVPVDVESFNTFQQNLPGIRRVRLETDGNLKAYYWTGSDWILDYQAITDTCQLPSSCGSYSLCKPGNQCSCLDNRTDYGPIGCSPAGNRITGNFCYGYGNRYKVVRSLGLELPFKELMRYTRMRSIGECEGACERNCSCWGAVYSNSSGFCYMLDYPVQTVVAVGDVTKVGYFKVREGVGRRNVGEWVGLGLGLLFGVILILAGVLGLGWYKSRNRGVKGYVEEDGVGAGKYKGLGAASFRSIELCEK